MPGSFILGVKLPGFFQLLQPSRIFGDVPVDDAARVEALAELFPGNSTDALITDLLSKALDELEASMPYVPGDNVIREDEFGDPIYEDVGLTPRFLELVKAQRTKLSST